MTDFDSLVEMGFDARRVKLALAKTGGLQDAITWLDKNSETSIDELEAKFGGSSSGAAKKADAADGEEEEEDQAKLAQDAKSLKCTDCGKLFSTPERAQFHAIKRLDLSSPFLYSQIIPTPTASTPTLKSPPKPSHPSPPKKKPPNSPSSVRS